MIKRLINHGFKDQHRVTEFSGMDLFTSDDVNGVGKSSVLEAVKLALLGEIPGRARTLDDLLQFTSGSEMSVKITLAACSREVTAERRFLRVAERGERRPIIIDQLIRKYEEGDRWIRDTFGAVSIGFDPYEFLNLTDQKKRQWIISHSPESRELGREVLYSFLFSRMVESRFGAGIVREQALRLGIERGLFDKTPAGAAFRLLNNLSEIIRCQDAAWVHRVRAILDELFSLWSDSCLAGGEEEGHSALQPSGITPEENIASMVAHLKAETLRLRNTIRERTTTLSCLGETDEKMISDKIEGCRGAIRLLIKGIEDFDGRIEKSRRRTEELMRRQERRRFLQTNIAGLTQDSGKESAIDEKLRELAGRLVDTRDLQEELDRLNGELSECSETCRRQEARFLVIAGDLKRRRGKMGSFKNYLDRQPTLAGVCGENHREFFTCPIADEIRCETDMRPHRELLEREIGTMERQENEARSVLEKAREDLRLCGDRVRDLQGKVRGQVRSNETLRQEMRILQGQLLEEEKSRAKVHGMLKAYREEVEMLNSEPTNAVFEHSNEGLGVLESKRHEFMINKKREEAALELLLRDHGRAEAVAEVLSEKVKAEQELNDVQLLADLLGPDGVQGEMAARIAEALEREVNATLKLIDANLDFTLDLSGTRFLMGWNRDGKVIPFKTINSAHFTLFIVPFLAVLLKRMGRVREREDLPTLKVLCIEAESMTPKNLVLLLKGLSVMKAKGYLDNVLVAHYTSIRDTRKLSGFKEHILEKGEEIP